MAMGTPAVNRWQSVRITRSVPFTGERRALAELQIPRAGFDSLHRCQIYLGGERPMQAVIGDAGVAPPFRGVFGIRAPAVPSAGSDTVGGRFAVELAVVTGADQFQRPL